MTERNERGQFLPGNKASPGRPSRASENNYLQKITELVTPDKWEKIINRAVADAIKGNGYARSWISDYVVGKPPQILELRGTDALLLSQVLKQFQANGVSASDVFEAMLNEMALESAANEH